MDEQIKKIVKNGEKEKKGGIISLSIFLIFTILIALIGIFVHEIITLLVVFIVIDLIFVFMIVDGNNHIKNPQKYIQKTIQNANSSINLVKDGNSAFSGYKSKWTWDDAAKEYLQLVGKDSIDNLTEDENDKIYEYASMPAVYFLMWLVDKNYMSENFYQDINKDEINKLKMRQISPVEFFVHNMDCSLVRDEISETILPFVDSYFESEQGRNYINLSNINVSDYCECIKNDKNFIFCIDFSWNICDKVSEKINSAYNNFKNELNK